MSTAQRQTLPWPTRCLMQSLDEVVGFPHVSTPGGSPLSFPVALFVRPTPIRLLRELLVSKCSLFKPAARRAKYYSPHNAIALP